MHSSVNWILKFKERRCVNCLSLSRDYQMHAGDLGFCYGGQNIFIDHLLLKNFRDVNHFSCPYI